MKEIRGLPVHKFGLVCVVEMDILSNTDLLLSAVIVLLTVAAVITAALKKDFLIGVIG